MPKADGVIWNFESIKRPFVLDYCSTLRSRSFHLLTQINIHFASRYFGVPSLRSVSLRKIRFVQFGFIDFRLFKIGKSWIASGFYPRNDEKFFRPKWTTSFKPIYLLKGNRYQQQKKVRMDSFLIGWDGRIRTSEMAGPKPAALPLGDVPMGYLYIIKYQY